jgi:hypothetical protein
MPAAAISIHGERGNQYTDQHFNPNTYQYSYEYPNANQYGDPYIDKYGFCHRFQYPYQYRYSNGNECDDPYTDEYRNSNSY